MLNPFLLYFFVLVGLMYSTSPVESSLQMHSLPFNGPHSARPSHACQDTKVKGGRELPSCMASVVRDKGQFCLDQPSGYQRPARDPCREAEKLSEDEYAIPKGCYESESPPNRIHKTVNPQWSRPPATITYSKMELSVSPILIYSANNTLLISISRCLYHPRYYIQISVFSTLMKSRLQYFINFS